MERNYGGTAIQNGHRNESNLNNNDHDEERGLLSGRLSHTKSKQAGTASAFATFGFIWTIISAQVFIRWVSSDEFRPAPVFGPDEFATWRLVSLRIFETLSIGVLLAHIWYCIIIPAFPKLKKPKGRQDLLVKDLKPELSLDGRHVIGGMIALFADGILDCYQYIFMWNSHNVNLGVWARFLPFHNHEAKSRYAESLLWGPPMYIYFCTGYGILGCALVKQVRKRLGFWQLTNAGIFTIVWIIEFIIDFVIENLAIRATHGYGYSKTYGPLTLFKGQTHQFPIYESVFVATLGVLFTAVRLEAIEGDGISPVERGYDSWPRVVHQPVRILAVIGFCAFAVLFVYHLPLNWLGLIGDCHADIPSYMLPG